MINLLPPDNKREIRAARSNTLLIRYNFFLLGALGFILLATGFAYVYLGNTRASAQQTIQESEAKVADYADVRAQADEFRRNLKIAQQILSNDVGYSELVLNIAELMPAGTVLDNLSLDAKTFGKPTTLNIRARSYADALEIKNSFQESDLFSNVHFESISGGGGGAYPITVTLSVTIEQDAAS